MWPAGHGGWAIASFKGRKNDKQFMGMEMFLVFL